MGRTSTAGSVAPLLVLSLVVASSACDGEGRGEDAAADGDADIDVDSDADAGSDADADPDGDQDGDGEADVDADAEDDADAFVPVRCEPSSEPLCGAAHELPIPTHWSEARAGHEFLAADQPVILLPEPYGMPEDPALYVPGECYRVYNHGWMPTTDVSVASDFSEMAVGDDEARAWAEAACRDAGVPVRHLLPPYPDGSLAGAGPESDGCQVQVVNTALVEGSLFTVLLPPSWSEDAPEGTYPIVANGFYDINMNVFTQVGPFLARLVAESGLEGRRGVIGVLWNGGGAAGGATMSPRARDQFAAVVEEVVSRYRANRDWIVLFGGSRGGLTALAMASNPSGHDYRVVFASAAAPPTLIGEHARLRSPTFPAVMAHIGGIVGLADSWKEGWRYPACAGRPELTGLLGWEAHLRILTGTSDPEVADSTLSPLSPPFLDGLERAGTQVHLEVTGHDNIVPSAHQVRYAQALEDRGVPAEVLFLVRAGHGSDPHLIADDAAAPPVRVLYRVVLDAARQLVDPAFDLDGPVPTFVSPGARSFHRVDRETATLEAFSPAGGRFPFSVEVPYLAFVGQELRLVVVGEPGTEWRLEASLDGVEPPHLIEGVVPAEMAEARWILLAPGFLTGRYLWALEIREPGGPWVEVPSTSTPTGEVCSTTVIAEEPVWPHTRAAREAQPPTLPPFLHTSWGLSEH